MNIEKKKDICQRLSNIKAYIFQNTIAKIDYLNIQKTTGETLPFYAQIVELNDIISELKQDIEE